MWKGGDIFCALTYNGIYYGGNVENQILFYPLAKCKDMYWNNDLFVIDGDGYKNQLSINWDGVLVKSNKYLNKKKYKLGALVDCELPKNIDKYYVSFIGEIILIKSSSTLILYQVKSKKMEIINDIKDVFGEYLSWYIIQ